MIRVFPRRTKWTPDDPLAFVGDPLFIEFMPKDMPVKISVTFTWDIPEGERLLKVWSDFFTDVQIGGPAFGDRGGEFALGMFLKAGVTITSRGCIRQCQHCFVPKREGMIRELEIKDGYIVQDNNLLACNRPHIKAVFDMLKRQKKAAIFTGGLDARLLRQWHRELFDSIRIKELWFACDSRDEMANLQQVVPILDGISINKRRCYVMIGFKNEALEAAQERLETVYALGFLPFAQLYRGKGERRYNQQWKDLARKWSRPAAYRNQKLERGKCDYTKTSNSIT